jgi:CheY-like chemotaxis protein
MADPAKLEQVLVNLVLNARDAMPGGGRIRLRTTERSIGPGNESGQQPGDYVVAAVSDTGVGMVGETLEHIFEPFFTTKEAGTGTGLGLSTAYAIVQEAGGVITVDSLTGRGTTFEVVLPRCLDVPTTPGAGEQPQPSETRAGGTILLVEDDDGVRELVAESLEAAGYEVLVADGPEAALGLASTSEQRIDLMLADVVMPGMTGVELGELLSDARPSMKQLFMSGYPDYDLGLAAESFLEKPFTPEQLVSRVAALLDDDSRG